jgi:signal transduction histidine kinase/CheY-like chemotaxis protein
LSQKNHLEDINVKLEEQQEEINSQKEELQSQNNHLEEVNRQLDEMNKKLVKNQLEIEKKNRELDEHRNNLEGLVSERTRELDYALQKAEESDRLKSAFLANMSHEIRTPLNGITGFSNLIVDPAISENEKETYARIISQCSGQLLNIVNDILDISQIEAGIVSLNPEKTELISFLKDLQQFYLSQAKGRSLSIEFIDNSEDSKLYTEVDVKKLRQILDNLLGNALKFTNEGFVRFGFERKDNILQFFVQDSGIGIPPEMQKVIFERFRQGEIKMDTKYGGNGLGLAISEKLVMLMGGRIWVESEEGKGSVFYFTIPFRPVSEKPKVSADHKASQLHEGFPSDGIILVVEDDDLSYSYLEVLIKRMGIKILRASSGEDAIEACRQNRHIELVLMDVKLPVLNGWAATRAIKEFRPELPVIMQTAFAMHADMVKSFEAGCDDYISKPVDKLTLNAIISKYVNGHSESSSGL